MVFANICIEQTTCTYCLLTQRQFRLQEGIKDHIQMTSHLLVAKINVPFTHNSKAGVSGKDGKQATVRKMTLWLYQTGYIYTKCLKSKQGLRDAALKMKSVRKLRIDELLG